MSFHVEVRCQRRRPRDRRAGGAGGSSLSPLQGADHAVGRPAKLRGLVALERRIELEGKAVETRSFFHFSRSGRGCSARVRPITRPWRRTSISTTACGASGNQAQRRRSCRVSVSTNPSRRGLLLAAASVAVLEAAAATASGQPRDALHAHGHLSPLLGCSHASFSFKRQCSGGRSTGAASPCGCSADTARPVALR